jgi:Clp amino terminal domain, pathogenicity island component
MNDHTAGYPELPRTAYLDHTLRRARTAAEQRSHRYVTLEHLLLALLDDPDAVKIIQATGADLPVIKSSIANTVNNRMTALAVPDGRAPSFSYKFESLFLTSSQDAIRVGRSEVDGALALVALAKDREGSASAILAANGFNPEAALRVLGSPLAYQPPHGQGARAPAAAPAPAFPAAPGPETSLRPSNDSDSGTDDTFMEDMLANVRNILDAEERKERGHLPVSPPPPLFPPVTAPAQPRFEPQLRIDPMPGRQPGQSETSLHAYPQGYEKRDSDARPGPGQTARGGQAGAPVRNFELQPVLDPEPLSERPSDKKPRARREKTPRSRGESAPNRLGGLLDAIPRRFRSGSSEIVEIKLTREEAQAIFAQAGRRGQPHLGREPQAFCRAVTIRLSAPDGGLLIESSSAETQWIFDRPSFLGEETFGSWAWTVISGGTGFFALTVSMSARDLDGNGVVADLKVPGQSIKVRVHGSFLRGLAGFLSALLLLLAGSGLTVGAWYALKVMGKLPF